MGVFASPKFSSTCFKLDPIRRRKKTQNKKKYTPSKKIRMRNGQQDVTGLSKTTTTPIISVGELCIYIYICRLSCTALRVEHVNKIH